MTELQARRQRPIIDICIEESGGTVLISAAGAIDLESAPRLLGALDMIDPERHVVLDMAGVDFMDSTGLSIIIRQSIRKRESGGSLLIRHPSPTVRRLLEFCCLDHFIEPDA